MSCFGCGKKYGLFTKEYGCPNCGYSYCLKCLKRPISVPRHNGKVLNVCLICFDKLSKLESSEKVIDCEALPGTIVTNYPKIKGATDKTVNIDDALFKDEPPPDLGAVLTPISGAAETTTHSNSEIDENLDSVISKRLKGLRSLENAPSTDDELRAKLANLTGMPQKDYDKKDLLLSTDQRTDQEKMKDLLEQFLGETELDKRIGTERNDAISDIERRLRALRNDPLDDIPQSSSANQSLSNKKDTPSDNEDDETVLKSIMEKYLAEAKLPEGPTNLEAELAATIPLPPAGMKPEDTEELPWCNICNEDAVYRCKGCDGELFCSQCFRDCHDDDEEYRAHVKETFTVPPKFKEDHF